jgi:hypothetical protein
MLFRKISSLLFVLSFVLSCTDLYSKENEKEIVKEKLIDFEVEDQFKQKYTDEDFLGELFLVIGSDKKGRKFNPKWTIAIRDALKGDNRFDNLKIFRVADMRGVPGIIKGLVRSKFPKEKSEWVALDWKGVFARSYSWEKKLSNILMFDSKGTLIYKDKGKEPQKEKIEKIVNIIKGKFSYRKVPANAPE